MAAYKTSSRSYTWRNSEDFQVPDNSVWYGRDDDGSDIFCGKAWCEGEEVPAQVIPNRKECRVIHNGCEKVVPNCRKVLVCNDSEEDRCHRQRDHCHRRRHHQCYDSSSSDSEEESSTTTKKSSTCNNESKVLEKSVKSCSSSTITTVKKSSKKHHKKRECRGEECWYERRTRMVPKVTVQPRIEYIPKVTNERTVRYVQDSYVTRVCGRRRCEPCEPCEPCDPCEPCEPCDPCEPSESCGPCDPCEPCEPCEPCDPCDPCSTNRGGKTILYSAESGKERFIQPRRCSSKSPLRKLN